MTPPLPSTISTNIHEMRIGHIRSTTTTTTRITDQGTSQLVKSERRHYFPPFLMPQELENLLLRVSPTAHNEYMRLLESWILDDWYNAIPFYQDRNAVLNGAHLQWPPEIPHESNLSTIEAPISRAYWDWRVTFTAEQEATEKARIEAAFKLYPNIPFY